MTEQDLSQKVLTDIKEQKIAAKPRWEFLLKDYFIWFLFVISVIVGSLAVSVIIFVYRNNALSLMMKRLGISEDMFELPYFWLLILLVFIVIAYYNFHHTKQGYKYSVYWVMLASVLVSILGGTALYFLKGGQQLEQAVYQRLPLYQKMVEKKGKLWLDPEQGRLAGVIVSDIYQQDETVNFELKSVNGDKWNVACDHSEDFNQGLFRPGIRVIIFGQVQPPNNFYAEEIMPWFAPKERVIRFHQRFDERNNEPLRSSW